MQISVAHRLELHSCSAPTTNWDGINRTELSNIDVGLSCFNIQLKLTNQDARIAKKNTGRFATGQVMSY